MQPLIRHFPEGTTFDTLDPDELRQQITRYKVVVLRGLAIESPVEWPASVARLGPLQAWPFGSVHEVKVDPEAENYLYTTNEVPLHWDGAFKGEVPGILAFLCHTAPPPGAGGQTLFVDTTALFRSASPATQASLKQARYRYQTEKKAHYGGTFEADVVSTHPLTGETILRYAEPVNDLNPVSVTAIRPCPELAGLLETPSARYLHEWRDGDVLLVDNHALLHGRTAFHKHVKRHLLRINVLDDDGDWKTYLTDLLNIRRPEFLFAEIPILLLPLGLLWSDHASTSQALLSAAVLWLLFQAGDMANCLADRHVDLAGKTKLAEAVRRLGVTSLKRQILGTGLLALACAIALGPVLCLLTVLGILLGVQYSLPPIKAKSRGLLQLPYSAGILFVGPMVFLSQAMAGSVSPFIVAVALAFGTMQQGALLINIVEDLREDIHHGYHTAGVALGRMGSVLASWALNALGGLALMVLLSSAAPWWSLLPFFVAWIWVLSRIGDLALQLYRFPEEARDRIRKRVSELPGWLSGQAWMALIPAWLSL